MNKERKETLMRIVVGIATGILLGIWQYLIIVLTIVNFFYTLFTKKRYKEIAEMCETWNTQYYVFLRYVTFVSNERPFPFTSLTKNISKFSK